MKIYNISDKTIIKLYKSTKDKRQKKILKVELKRRLKEHKLLLKKLKTI